MTKHADRIWRTVVFAGAMLGAPLVSADTAPAKEAKPAPKAPPPKPPDTVTSVTKEIEELDKQLGKAVDAVVASQTDADRQAAKAKLESLRKTKAEREQKLAELKRGPGKPPPPSPPTPLARAEKELADHQVKIDAAVDAVASAQSEADRQAAKAKLVSLQRQKSDLEKKVVAEKQKLQRPRTPETDRPVGRGFILS